MFYGNPNASSFFESSFFIFYFNVANITFIPFVEFSCIFLENACNDIENYFVLSLFLINKSSFDIGSLLIKFVKERLDPFKSHSDRSALSKFA